MTDQLLELLTTYGLPALFSAMILAAAGMPFPSSLTLVAMGSFVAQGELSFWPVVFAGASGAIVGDQLGYAFGRYGGRPLLAAVTKRIGGADKVEQAEAYSRKWAGWGIFFSRWLIGPLGPWINVTSGLTEYPWVRFIVLDVAGEVLWLLIYVSLGRAFSDQVQTIASLLGNLTWVIVGVLVAGLLGWKLFGRSTEVSDDAA
ncbi:membrane protein DedA with SNARE-associated domain [Sphingomonas sp. PP-CE-1A-559]|uniref:DedA family protein n=1 Tax=Sphingomonas sp. PP-CE-1A-559 TaxID=2135657 RepID=UPI00105552F8|nr:DedA family protein [Sphingomonas sp. PP-CE-1A-559]TCP93195.1 membrane protein DedA with SNARE-associated domain [Sphingomonas sp. PP-CE-1A-559]